MKRKMDSKNLKILAAQIRLYSIRSMYSSGGGHVGGSLSLAEVLAVLYGTVMNYDPQNPKLDCRDKLVLSKGHCGSALYAALALSGFFPIEMLKTLNKNGTHLPSHCDMNKTPGVDMTTGSLGQGASLAAGLALGKKLRGKAGNVYLILGDGECNEGQVWEMAMFAKQQQLDNLIAFVDWNHQQLDGFTKDICDMGDIDAQFAAFGWHSSVVDGHDVEAIQKAATEASERKDKIPTCIVLNTVKGKGWSLVEGKPNNHHLAITDEMMAEAENEFTAVLNGLSGKERLS